MASKSACTTLRKGDPSSGCALIAMTEQARESHTNATSRAELCAACCNSTHPGYRAATITPVSLFAEGRRISRPSFFHESKPPTILQTFV